MIKRSVRFARRKLSAPEAGTAWRERADISPVDQKIIAQCEPYTMTRPERVLAVIDAVRYCVRRGIPGDFAECGVWKGGSVLAMVLTLQDEGVQDRDIWLYDTFEGMTAPTERDVSPYGGSALDAWRKARQKNERVWEHAFGEDVFDEAGVRDLLIGTGYPAERLHFVRGPVEETIPDNAAETLSLLRLDTDWYESTKHELEHLYPRLSEAGVLIIDDYGFWRGSQVAVDEYFADQVPVLLNRIDHTGRLVIKPGAR